MKNKKLMNRSRLLCDSVIMIGQVVLLIGVTSFFKDISDEILSLKRRIDYLETEIFNN